ncbi:MAG TPA: DUF2911 domain-containing protein [Gemmatimonadaceae bacterium]
MSLRFTTAAFLLLTAGSVKAQSAPAYIVTRLGVDTVAVERYTRSRDRLEGDLALRYPRVRTVHYVADLGPRGEIKSFSTVTRRPGADPNAPPAIQATASFADSTAVFEVHRGGKVDSATSGKKVFHGVASPLLGLGPPSYGIYEQLISSSALDRDSAVYALVSPGNNPTSSLILHRRGADSVVFNSTFFPGWIEVARVDRRGQILGVDARATTIKTIAQRVPSVDMDNVLRSWAAAEVAKGGATGEMSPPDTVKASVAGANIAVAYSRPLKRGRVIFGQVVPYDQVWRTGANAATMFTTDKDLVFGNTVVPVGKYTLWSLPTATGAKLIINSETGQWGTDYHGDKDFTRLDLTSRQVSPPVEQFVIGIVPQSSGGLLRFAWDDREYSIPFTVKP